MTPRPPSPVLVVDASILVSAVITGRVGTIMAIAAQRNLCTSAEAVREARRRVSDPRLADPANEGLLAALLQAIAPADADVGTDLLPLAARALRHAPASANGSEADAHLLALAWATDSDLWTHDGDFAGTGWPSWSSRNLLAALTGPEDL